MGGPRLIGGVRAGHLRRWTAGTHHSLLDARRSAAAAELIVECI